MACSVHVVAYSVQITLFQRYLSLNSTLNEDVHHETYATGSQLADRLEAYIDLLRANFGCNV
jgi:hypothetical protein